MKNKIDLTGQKFGKLTVLKKVDEQHWLCQCDCGAKRKVMERNLLSGYVQSCGCIVEEKYKVMI